MKTPNSSFMNKAVQEEIEKLTKIMVETVPVEKIYLFGSYAYGTPHKDSDLDFYVVLKSGAALRPIEADLKMRKAMRGVKTMAVDIVSHPQEVFFERARYPTLEKKVARDGILLYNGEE